MNEIAALNSKLESHNKTVNSQLSGLRSEIKELTSAFRELIRMDGEIKNVVTLIARIGGEVDDHEKRMRTLETSSTINSVKIGAGERVYWMLGTAALSLATGLIVYVVTH